MKEIIKRYTPESIRKIMAGAYHFFADRNELLLGRRDELTPPKRMLVPYGGDFRRIGEEFLRYFIELADLKPYERVLDVGCGIGRFAVPLTRYLDSRGGYEGFDVVPEWLHWCQRNISPRYPNFHFQLVDVFNDQYNPSGKYKASEFKFPYESGFFDFVFLLSVFTHMLPQDTENYLREISRVLKKGGRCLISFFLLNEESARLTDAGKSTLDFKYEFGNYRTLDRDSPELAVCYDEAFVLDLYRKCGLNIRPPVLFGSWCSRSRFCSYQDIIIASKGVYEAFDYKAYLNEKDQYLKALEQTVKLERQKFKRPSFPPEPKDSIIHYIDVFFQNENYVEIKGWAYIEGTNSEGSKTFIILKSDTNSYTFETRPVKRPDVTAHFKATNYDDSGFSVLIPNLILENGSYKVGIHIKKDDVEAFQYVDLSVIVSHKKDVSAQEI